MSNICIGLDIMGGDHAPAVRLQAAYQAALEGISLVLFGPKALIETFLEDHNKDWSSLPLHIIDAPELITMDDDPVESIQQKKRSSLVEGLKALKTNAIHSLVSAGNSGAILVGSVIHIGRTAMVRRPALVCFVGSHQSLLIDIGANSNIKPSCLIDFAYMGAAFVHLKRSIVRPRVGLLSNGSESSKGSLMVKEAHILLENHATIAFEFVGNCEPADIFKGKVDIIVTDGFSGNILIKSVEATLQQIYSFFREELNVSLYNRVIGLLMRPLFRTMHEKMKIPGGALLLGLERPVIVAHGAAQVHEIYSSLRYAYQLVDTKMTEKFGNLLEQYHLKDRVVKK